ncbi:MAG: hypothetical protein K1X64_11150 [Myxococcaceae bacterium]|nr:hypothetical protein [Myxococcaceae bacterium]
MQTLSFKIAQCVFGLHLPSQSLRDIFSSAWNAFASTETPEVNVHVQLTRSSTQVGLREMPQVRAEKDGSFGIETADVTATISADGTRADVDGSGDRFPVESVVKLLLARRLLAQGGLLVHGVGVAAKENAALFVADSGEGKSTLGEHSTRGGLTRLADELVAVLPDAGQGVKVMGTPWNVGVPLSARLCLLGTLGWSAAPYLEPAPSALLAPKLLSNSLLFDASPAGRARVFQAASELLNAVTCVKLYFAPDASVAATLRETLASFSAE